MMEMMVILIMPLVLTILIELGVLLLMGERQAVRDEHVLEPVIVGELVVVVVEALWYYAALRKWKKAMVYSVLCNAISFLSGLLLLLLLLTFLHSY